MKELLLTPEGFRLDGRLWLQGPADRFMGIGRLELLGHIAQTGSISKAAQVMGMSYKKAWDLVSSMNAQVKEPLVSTQTGGSHGGGTVLTPAGQRVMVAFQAMQTRFQEFVRQETERLLAENK